MTDDEIMIRLRDIRCVVNAGYKNGVILSARQSKSIVDVLDAIRLELYNRKPREEDDS